MGEGARPVRCSDPIQLASDSTSKVRMHREKRALKKLYPASFVLLIEGSKIAFVRAESIASAYVIKEVNTTFQTSSKANTERTRPGQNKVLGRDTNNHT